MRYAARTDTNHAQIVRELRDCGCHVEDLSAVGGGVPDLIVASPSGDIMLWVEVKTDRGKMTPLEEAWFDRWPEETRMIARSADDVLRRMGLL